MRYGEHVLAARGGVARAAATQGIFALERLFRGPIQISNYTQWCRELRRGDAL
jgi:hypothetical protein